MTMKQAKIATVHVGHYTREDGVHVWQPHFRGMPMTKELDNHRDAMEIARAYYHTLSAPKQLTDWNGDSSTETVLDEVTA